MQIFHDLQDAAYLFIGFFGALGYTGGEKQIKKTRPRFKKKQKTKKM